MTPRRIARIAFALIAGLALHAMPAAAQQPGRGGGFGPVDPRAELLTYRFAETGEDMPYAVFVSSKVSDDEPSPLIVALHGLGGSQETMVRETYRAVELAEAGGYILVAPMGYNPQGWYGIPAGAGGRGGGRGRGAGAPAAENAVDPALARSYSEQDVMNVLAMARERFNVDENRIYLMGHSMGGAGTLFLGVKHASIWAALAPIAPAAFSLDPASLAAVPDMPVIIVQGDADTAVPVDNTRLWAAKLEELDMTHEYLELAGGDHMSVIADGMPAIFDFFDSHSKSSR